MPADLNRILDRLEDAGELDSDDALFEAFADWAAESGRPLYPHQEEALVELIEGNHVIAQTPTGSGKSMIALAGHFLSLARGGRSYYTAPLKALVSEKFFELVDAFGARNVGMVTGDAALNAEAPIICCTAEILANQTLREGAGLDTDMVIMDEFHFYSDPQRGWAWQVPLLGLPRPQFVALSATLGDTSELAADIERRTGRQVSTVAGAERPVPLEYEYCKDELPVVVERLLKEGRSPIYIVHFAQRDAVATAQALAGTSLVTKEQKQRIKAELATVSFARGFGQKLRALLSAGIGVHHAGMLPRYRRLVERLTQQGLLAVVCGTDTLGVGINVPIRTVLFTSLVKFDGRRSRHLSAREFHQIAGRAGRAGYDNVGFVRTLASPVEIEQASRRAKLSAAQEAKNTKKLKKLKKQGGAKASREGKITWSEATFNRLVGAQPETMRSQFETSHALFLNVLAGPGDPEERLLELATDNHEQTGPANPHLRELGDIYRSLRQARVVERVSQAQAAADGKPRLRPARDLPDDFALNQPLAPFALAALELLDPDSPDFTLDTISVIESVMEDPSALLWAQQRRERDQAFHAMKAEGLDYAERRDALEEVTWPKPLAEMIDPAFTVFAQTNPWVGGRQPSPKTVLREMVEYSLTFSGLISRYDLDNAEGVVLRYLSDLYRALRQIPPARFVTPELEAVIDWLGGLLRSVDSSLLDEWERMASLESVPTSTGGTRASGDAALESGPLAGRADSAGAAGGQDQLDEAAAFGTDAEGNPLLAQNPYALRRLVRNQAFQRVEMLSRDDVERLGRLDADAGWEADRWDQALGRYWAEHDWLGTDADARSAEYFRLDEKPEPDQIAIAGGLPSVDVVPQASDGSLDWWLVEQTILDPAGDGDWRLTLLVDLPATFEQNRPVLRMLDFAPR